LPAHQNHSEEPEAGHYRQYRIPHPESDCLGQAIKTTPTNKLMDEVILGQTKVAGPGWITIKTKVNMVTPKTL